MSLSDIKTIAVLGAGTMGNGIAHVFARSGYKVILRDVERRFLDRGMETIGKNVDREIKKGKISQAEKGTVLSRLQPVTDMAAIAAADFVVEAVPEKIEIKRAVLGVADGILPLELADFIGLDVCVDILQVLQEGLGDPKYRACPLLKKYVAAGWRGRKSGRGFYSYDR